MNRRYDPDLAGLSEAEQIRLSGHGVYLDGPIGSRLRREVAQRWNGERDEYWQGWRDRDAVAVQATREWHAQERRRNKNFVRLSYLCAAGWFAALIVWWTK